MNNNLSIGIYKIINNVNGKYYVGSSNDVCSPVGRWQEHISALNSNRHPNDYLQRSWNKYGASAFSFIFVENTSLDQLRIKEQEYLDIAEQEQDKTYNLKFVAGPGGRFSEETRKKMRESKLGSKNPNYGKRISKFVREKMSNSHKGPRARSYDHTLYTFQNESGETFTGTRYDFVAKYGICRELIRDLIKRRQKKTHGWRLV